VPATRCDHDHHTPQPDGETAGWNTDPQCRHQHRAKTHAGFSTTRAGPHVTITTPTGHTHTRTDPPLPTGNCATDPWATGHTHNERQARRRASVGESTGC
jgi:hypothetical protein